MPGVERSDKKIKINGQTAVVKYLEGNSTKVEYPLLRSKLIPRGELQDFGDFLRRRGLRIAFTTGVYDMIHIGHARYLQLARSLGDILVVGLNTDDSVRRLKGENRPVLSEMQRAEMLSFLGFVDYV